MYGNSYALVDVKISLWDQYSIPWGTFVGWVPKKFHQTFRVSRKKPKFLRLRASNLLLFDENFYSQNFLATIIFP